MVWPKQQSLKKQNHPLQGFIAHFEGVHTASAMDAAAGAQGTNKQHIISQNESVDPDLIPPPTTTFRELPQLWNLISLLIVTSFSTVK